MQIVKNAAAGTMESSDAYVEIEPAEGLQIQLESVVAQQFGDAIRTVVQEVHWEAGGQVQTVLTDVTLNGTRQPDAYWTWYLDEEEVLPDWLQPGAHVQMTAEVYHPQGRTNPGGFDFRADFACNVDSVVGAPFAEGFIFHKFAGAVVSKKH